jgi:hypothetical protein
MRSSATPGPGEAARGPDARPALRRPIQILPQPDDASCGPTCLHALYRAYGDEVELETVIGEVPSLETGGTLAVALGCHALRRGYLATLQTFNLTMFDPTWFSRPGTDLAARLRAQAEHKNDRKLRAATVRYLEYLELGGRIEFPELNRKLVSDHLSHGQPILVGLSATYLYACARETGDRRASYDDVRGDPVGHFVLLCDYDRSSKTVRVADPNAENPAFLEHHYDVAIDRLLGAIMLGALTYDANLLLIAPRSHGETS